jgi:anti-anti-sigma factor
MHHDITRVRLFSRRAPGHIVLAVHGELDIATTASLRDRIALLLEDATKPLIIDLSGVSFCDASGLAVLVGAQRRAKPRGITVALAAPRRASPQREQTASHQRPRPFLRHPSHSRRRAGTIRPPRGHLSW